MAFDSDLQSAFSDALDGQLEHYGDEVTIGVLTIPCLSSVVEASEEDPGGGDRSILRVRIQCKVAALTSGVPALHSAFTYQGTSFKIVTKQTTDDGVSITFIGEEDL